MSLADRIAYRQRRAAFGPPGLWLRAATLLVSLFLLLPSCVVVAMSFSAGKLLTFPPQGFSVQWYANVFASKAWSGSIVNSLQVALLATAGATVLGTLAAVGLVRGRPRGAGLIRAVLLSPMIVPVLVSGLGFYISVQASGLGTFPSLVLAHIVLATPFVLLTVSASLFGLPRHYEMAAYSLGAGRGYTFMHVTLPLILPGVATGALFAFVTSWDEIVAALFLSGPKLRTLPVTMWEQARHSVDPTIAAASSLLTLLTLLVLLTALIRRRFRRTAG